MDLEIGERVKRYERMSPEIKFGRSEMRFIEKTQKKWERHVHNINTITCSFCVSKRSSNGYVSGITCCLLNGGSISREDSDSSLPGAVTFIHACIEQSKARTFQIHIYSC